MNLALDQNGAGTLRDWLSESDRWLSPQAVILSPQATWEIAQAIVAQASDYHRTVAAGQTAIRLLKDAVASGHLKLSKSEAQWLHRMEEQFESLPANEGDLLAEMTAKYSHLFRPASYGL